jgi:hypothetical protein
MSWWHILVSTRVRNFSFRVEAHTKREALLEFFMHDRCPSDVAHVICTPWYGERCPEMDKLLGVEA